MTFYEHVDLIRQSEHEREMGTLAQPVALTNDNVIGFLQSMAAVLEEQNVQEEGRWIIMYVWRGRRGTRTNKDYIRRRLDKKRNPLTWHLRHKERK